MEKRSMSAVDYSDYRRMVRWMEDEEALQRGVSIIVARRNIAREMGVPVGTLEYIRRGRLKALRGYVERAIDAALVKFLQRQKSRIEHELALANARLGDGREGVVARAEAAREALAALIGEARS